MNCDTIKCRDCQFGSEEGGGFCTLKKRPVTLDSERKCKVAARKRPNA